MIHDQLAKEGKYRLFKIYYYSDYVTDSEEENQKIDLGPYYLCVVIYKKLGPTLKISVCTLL